MVDKYNNIKGLSDATPELPQPIFSLHTHFNGNFKPIKRAWASLLMCLPLPKSQYLEALPRGRAHVLYLYALLPFLTEFACGALIPFANLLTGLR
jgi:hypothetical protein